MSEPPDLVEGVHALAQIDGAAMLRAIEAIPPDVYLSEAAVICGYISPFVPPLATVKLALSGLAIIVKCYELGLIKSADPEDPAMQRATGPDNFSSGG